MKRIYIDMDGVLVDFEKAHREALRRNPTQPYPQSQLGFFLNLELIKGAVWAVSTLQIYFDVYFLTAPSTKNPLCYTEKRMSIEKHFGFSACSKLIICENKSLLIGDFLVDDRIDSHKQNEFVGKLIHFGSEEFPDWFFVVDYLKENI
jgi:5'(3')-deoxyribonucleotidase